MRFHHGTYTSKLSIWEFSLTTSDCSYLSVSETQMLILQVSGDNCIPEVLEKHVSQIIQNSHLRLV